MADSLPIRTCAGCGQSDDHPRMHVANSMNPAEDLLFHYDCMPAYLRELHPSPAYEATAKGLRGEDVRKAVVKQAEKIAKES